MNFLLSRGRMKVKRERDKAYIFSEMRQRGKVWEGASGDGSDSTDADI